MSNPSKLLKPLKLSGFIDKYAITVINNTIKNHDFIDLFDLDFIKLCDYLKS
jgi:hypothetical protein